MSTETVLMGLAKEFGVDRLDVRDIMETFSRSSRHAVAVQKDVIGTLVNTYENLVYEAAELIEVPREAVEDFLTGRW